MGEQIALFGVATECSSVPYIASEFEGGDWFTASKAMRRTRRKNRNFRWKKFFHLKLATKNHHHKPKVSPPQPLN
jgi:hypothetical protein